MSDFRRLVIAKGRELRALSYEDLITLSEPTREVALGKRKGRISVLIERCDPDDKVKIIVQGFLDNRWFPRLKTVGLDGFYKSRDGEVAEIQAREFYGYD